MDHRPFALRTIADHHGAGVGARAQVEFVAKTLLLAAVVSIEVAAAEVPRAVAAAAAAARGGDRRHEQFFVAITRRRRRFGQANVDQRAAAQQKSQAQSKPSE